MLLLLVACIDATSPRHPGDDEPFVVEVEKGATAGRLAERMVEHGFVDAEWQWKMFLRGTDASCLKAGKFELRRSMSLDEVMATLCGPPLADEVSFTIIEGWRIRDVDAALAAAGLAPAGAYAEVALKKGVEAPFEVTSPTFEGYLYPETYRVPAKGVDPKILVTRQLQTFQERFLASHPGPYGERSLDQIVVMASMLEREEPKPENRPLVAGILWKRIDANDPLGVDATSRYTLPDWNDRKAFLVNLRNEDEPYNTRRKVGLPPTAIGNPTVGSLEAAISPQASEYWYYLHDAQGQIHPARRFQ